MDCGGVHTARVLVHSSDQAGEGLGTRLCILFASNPTCCQDHAVCPFLRLLQLFHPFPGSVLLLMEYLIALDSQADQDLDQDLLVHGLLKSQREECSRIVGGKS